MIVLASTDTLEVKLAAAKTSLDCPVYVSYVDLDATTFAMNGCGRQLSTTNGTSVVTILAAPAAGSIRVVKRLTIPVKDTGSITLTLQVYNGSLRYELINAVTFAVGDVIQDDGE